LAEILGVDISLVKEGIGTDSRIGMSFLNAGCGYGGSCFPKDVKALIWMARECGLEVPLFDAVENINIRQKCIIFNRLKKYFANHLKGKVIALWGLAFKPNTDDMREAPSKVLIELLCHEGAVVKAYDPVAMKKAELIYKDQLGFMLCNTRDETLIGADALAIVTEWDEFKEPDFEIIKNNLRQPVIFDGRNLFEPKEMKKLGIHYFCIGKGNYNHEQLSKE
jgi:UDPglucose 6-dehydrogenase